MRVEQKNTSYLNFNLIQWLPEKLRDMADKIPSTVGVGREAVPS